MKKSLMILLCVLMCMFSFSAGLSAGILDSADANFYDLQTVGAAPLSLDGKYDVQWRGSFNYNNENSNLINVSLPRETKNSKIVWTAPVGNGAIAIVDDYVYTYNGASFTTPTESYSDPHLYKVNKNTGEIVDKISLGIDNGYYYCYTCYGEGKIFVCCANYTVAVDIDTFKVAWTANFGGGAYATGQYHDGYLYLNGLVLNAKTGEKVAALGNYSYSSGVFIKNSAGHDIFYIAGRDGTIKGFDINDNWKAIDSFAFRSGSIFPLQPGTSYNAETNRLYWSDAMVQKIYSIALTDDHSGFVDESFLETSLSAKITTTCTPQVFKGRVYMAGQGTYGGCIEVLDATTLKSIYYAKGAGGKIQSTPLVDISSYEETGKVYVYGQEYSGPGNLYVLEDSADATSGTLTKLSTPTIHNYAYEQLACDENGAIYYTNDAMALMKLITRRAMLSSLSCSGAVGGDEIALSEDKAEYSVAMLPSAQSTTVSYTLPAGVSATFNGEASATGGEVTLTNGAGSATIVLTRDNEPLDTTTYTLTFVPYEGSTELSSLVVSSSNGDFSNESRWLPLTPSFSPSETYYVVAPKASCYFQAFTAYDTSTVTVYPRTSVGNSSSVKDGVLQQYTTVAGVSGYTAQVDRKNGMTYAIYDIVVSSLDGTSEKTYRLVTQSVETYGVSISEGSNSDMGEVSVDINNLRGAEGAVVTFHAAPKAGYAIETVNVIGQNSMRKNIVTAGEDQSYSFVMPAEPVSIEVTYDTAEKAVRTYNVITNVTGIRAIGSDREVAAGSDYQTAFFADPGYGIPSDLHVVMNGKELTKGTDYTFTENGTLLIPSVLGDTYIYVDDYSVTSKLLKMNFDGAETVQGYTAYSATLSSADPRMALPDNVKLTAGDQLLIEGVDYSYDLISGRIDVKEHATSGDIVIDYDFGDDFTVNAKGMLTQYTGAGGDVVIPEGIVSIPYGARGLQNNTAITSVTLPHTMTSLGSNSFENCTAMTKFIATDNLETVDNYVFSGCTALTELDLGRGVSSIGYNAFQKCTALKEIYLPDSVTKLSSSMFNGCSSLTSIRLPEGSLNTLANGCFKNATGLKEITIPKNIRVLEQDLFSGCSSLTDVTIKGAVAEIPISAFQECTALQNVALPDSVKTLGVGAFNNCDSLKKIDLPAGLETIGSSAFGYCDALESLTIPAGVSSIFYNAVIGSAVKNFVVDKDNEVYGTLDGMLTDKKGTTIYIYPAGRTESTFEVPAGVEALGDYAFDDATLTEVTLSEGLKSIGDYCFSGCSGIENIYIPASVETVGNKPFSGCSAMKTVTFDSNCKATIGTGLYQRLRSLKSANLPQGLTKIPDNTFTSCKLTSIEIPSTVTEIGASAFSSCTAVTEFNIPQSVTVIGASAFSGCTGLTSIELPKNLKSIGRTAFSKCSGLTTVEVPATVETLESGVFDSCSGLESVVLHDGLKAIGYQAFERCSKLTEVTLPTTVASIDARAFYLSNALAKCTVLNPATKIPVTNSFPGSTVLYGFRGSTTEEFATKNNRSFVALDDIIELKPTVANGVATSTLKEAAANANGYSISALSGDSSVTAAKVTIPASFVKQMTSVIQLVITTDLGEFVFDKNALALLGKASGDLTVALETKTEGFKNTHVGEYRDKVVYECSAVDGSGKNLLDESATKDKNVNIGFKLKYSGANADAARLCALGADGTLQEIASTCAEGTYSGTLNSLGTCLVLGKVAEPVLEEDLPAEELSYGQNEAVAPLKVVVDDDQCCSYQWYRLEGEDGEAVAIDGATEAAYTPSTAALGTTRYYVVVTKAYNGETKTKTSATATVTVKEYDGYVYFDVERITIGQGIIVEPMKLGFFYGDTLADISERGTNIGLGLGHTVYKGSTRDSYYLATIQDGGAPEGWTTEDIPEALRAVQEVNDGRAVADQLSHFDYSSKSGWYYGVDNVAISMGASFIVYDAEGSSDLTYTDGSVVRLCFTFYGLGEDCFESEYSTGEADINLPQKDALIRAMVDAGDKSTEAYAAALAVLANWEATQEEVDNAVKALNGEPVEPEVDEEVQAVIDLIAAIGEVTEDSGEAIAAAREAYDALTEEQQAEVANYDVLTAAEAAYDALDKDPEEPGVEVIDPSELPFEDLTEDWYKEAIAYVYSYELMNGTSDTAFEPQTTLNRAMMATILYRIEGEPAVKAENSFGDVQNDANGSWYYNAVLWASQNGIVKGYEDDTFRPVREITREEMAVMMYRYAEYKGMDMTATADFAKFSDGATVNEWAKPAMSWAVGVNLITGHDNGTLEPQGTATRAQAATVLMRFNELMK